MVAVKTVKLVKWLTLLLKIASKIVPLVKFQMLIKPNVSPNLELILTLVTEVEAKIKLF